MKTNTEPYSRRSISVSGNSVLCHTHSGCAPKYDPTEKLAKNLSDEFDRIWIRKMVRRFGWINLLRVKGFFWTIKKLLRKRITLSPSLNERNLRIRK